MSAEVLREAAALMRERAEGATEGPWEAHGGDVYESVSEHGDCVAEMGLTSSDARHIASWHPAVALAVADWLDAESWKPVTEHDGGLYTTGGPSTNALAVARAYLGRDS